MVEGTTNVVNVYEEVLKELPKENVKTKTVVSEVLKEQTSETPQVQSISEPQKQILPSTGEVDSATMSLVGGLILAGLGLFGLCKKKEHQ